MKDCICNKFCYLKILHVVAVNYTLWYVDLFYYILGSKNEAKRRHWEQIPSKYSNFRVVNFALMINVTVLYTFIIKLCYFKPDNLYE